MLLEVFFFENSRISEAITVPASHVGKLRDVTPPWPNSFVVSLTEEWQIWDSPDTRGAQMRVERSSHGDGGDEISKRDGKIYSMCFCFSMLVAI